MANTVYPNVVLESKATDLLTTSVNTRSLMSIDTSLQESAGMKKTINTYTYTGTAEEVAEGEGNTVIGSAAYVGKDYTVGVVQQAFGYTDEDVMKDPQIVDVNMKGATQVMVNKLTTDFYAALATEDEDEEILIKTSEFANGSKIGYDAIVDAIAEMNVEDESQLFLLISPAMKADIRKDEDYKAAQMGEVIYNGMIGTIAGIPVIVTKAIGDYAILATKEAVTCYMKKDVVVEQERDADKRTNKVYLRMVYVVALTDATKACKISEAAEVVGG